jgi:hypothetical protein
VSEVVSIALFLGTIAGFIAVLWASGAAWNKWWWIKDGRPTLTQFEQLEADILRAKGWTETAARREVIKKRKSDMNVEIASIRETEDLLFNPDREAELREVLTRMSEK